MKRLLCLLAVVALTAPTFADVTIVVTSNPGLKGVVTYTNDETERVRAMALDISVDEGAVITGISGYKTDGYSSSDDQGYGIYMTSIDLSTPESPVWGAPDADPADNDYSVGKVPGSDITVELGSLYDPDVQADAPVLVGGELFTITVDKACCVSIALNTDIGGIVLEGDPPTQANLGGGSGGCISGVPPCWNYLSQCHGDTDGDGDVDTVDWPTFRDGFACKYPEQCYIDHVCGDLDHDGDIDTVDWPDFRDNFAEKDMCPNDGRNLCDCTPGGTWPPETP